MTASDWCACVPDDPRDEETWCAAYADWLEEQGMPALAHAARRSLPRLVSRLSDDLENDPLVTTVDLCGEQKEGGRWLYGFRLLRDPRHTTGHFWREELACGLVVAAAWHYPTEDPTIPALAFIERTLPLRCASVYGSDPNGSVRARFARET
jgi:uncharacterized protein (TIGR02996 family)